MKKNLPIYVYGTIIIISGVFLLFSKYFTSQTIQFTIGISLFIGALLAFFAAILRKRKQVEFSYHEVHAMAMLVYGISVLFFCNNLETLIDYTSFLLFFYAFSEIIFCTWLFNLGRKVVYKIVFIRLILGLIVGLGVIVILYYPGFNKNIDSEGFGILFIIIGINILLYVPIMKIKKFKATLNNYNNPRLSNFQKKQYDFCDIEYS